MQWNSLEAVHTPWESGASCTTQFGLKCIELKQFYRILLNVVRSSFLEHFKQKYRAIRVFITVLNLRTVASYMTRQAECTGDIQSTEGRTDATACRIVKIN